MVTRYLQMKRDIVLFEKYYVKTDPTLFISPKEVSNCKL